MGYSVCLADTDPQCNATESFGVRAAYSDDVNGTFRRDVNKVGTERRWYLQSCLRIFTSANWRRPDCEVRYRKQHYFVSPVPVEVDLAMRSSRARTFCAT